MPELQYTLTMLNSKEAIKSIFVMDAHQDRARADAIKIQMNQILNNLTKAVMVWVVLGVISLILFVGVFILIACAIRFTIISRAHANVNIAHQEYVASLAP
jgi:cell division protein FtsX